MIDIPTLKHILNIFSWLIIPAIETAFFTFMIVMVIIAFKRLSNRPEIDRTVRTAYKEFKKLLIKDLGGDKQ